MENQILPHAGRRVRPRRIGALALAAAALAFPALAADREIFGNIDEIVKGLAEITGWKVHKPVPADFISKDQLRAFLDQRIHDEVKPEEIRVEELTLKMFGLVPDDFDLKKTTVDLISEQAAAFYDPKRRKLFLIDSPGNSGLEARAALVHELAHALADQNFRLERYVKKSGSDDASTARQAVMEGQATWLMWAYVNRSGGGVADVSAAALDATEALSDASSAQYPVLEKAPLYLRESLLFPYTKGLRFQDAVFRSRGKEGFSEVFRRPPETTQQILHPKDYVAEKRPAKVEAPRLASEKGYRKTADGTIGEFDQYILLRQYGNEAEARRLSAHWAGGAFRLLESKHGGRPILLFTAGWDTPEAARSYFAAYQAALKGKSKRFTVSRQTDAELAGTGDRGGFELQLDGNRVISKEGLPEPALH